MICYNTHQNDDGKKHWGENYYQGKIPQGFDFFQNPPLYFVSKIIPYPEFWIG